MIPQQFNDTEIMIVYSVLLFVFFYFFMKNLKNHKERAIAQLKRIWWLPIHIFLVGLKTNNLSIILTLKNTLAASFLIILGLTIWYTFWKRCPYCRKRINSYATKCRHCTANVD